MPNKAAGPDYFKDKDLETANLSSICMLFNLFCHGLTIGWMGAKISDSIVNALALAFTDDNILLAETHGGINILIETLAHFLGKGTLSINGGK